MRSIPIAVMVLLAGTMLALLAVASVLTSGVLRRVLALRSDMRPSSCRTPCASMAAHRRTIRTFRVRPTTPVQPTAEDGHRIEFFTDASTDALVAAVRCGSVDTLMLGPFILGLTGATGAPRASPGRVWIGVRDGDLVPATHPIDASASLQSARKAVVGASVLLAWSRAD